LPRITGRHTKSREWDAGRQAAPGNDVEVKTATRNPTVSTAQARRIALAAQGFGGPRPAGRVTMSHLERMIRHTGLIQIDSVNVLVRAHLMPLYSRSGPYDPGLIARASGRSPRRLVEYWAHEASLVPPDTHRLLRWRMARADREAWRTVRAAGDQPELLGAVLDQVTESGPATATEIGRQIDPGHVPDRNHWGWNWPPVKSALEYLFWSGQITSASRTPQFERRYDLPERVLPPEVLASPDPGDEEAVESLIEISARAHGIATMACLRDYFRLPATESRQAVEALVERGRLIPVSSEAFRAPAFLHAEARRPRRVEGRALLSPFDPLVFERTRTESLFGFHYRIEIYTPKHKRRHGYYVLPFLLNESLVARADLKADREASVLRVHAAFAEEAAPPETAIELAAELELLASWLGLGSIEVTGAGDLGPALRSAVG
jgi:uncharacterized protein YcaQ